MDVLRNLRRSLGGGRGILEGQVAVGVGRGVRVVRRRGTGTAGPARVVRAGGTGTGGVWAAGLAWLFGACGGLEKPADGLLVLFE